MTVNEDVDDGIPLGVDAHNFSSLPSSLNDGLGIINYGPSDSSVFSNKSELNEAERAAAAEGIANDLRPRP